MNKNVKLVLTASILSLGVAFSSVAFGGCGDTNGGNENESGVITPNPDQKPSEDNTEIEEPNGGQEEDNDSEIEDSDKEPEEDDSQYEIKQIPRTDLNNFYKLVRDGKNYTVTNIPVTGNGFGGSLEREGNKMHYTDVKSGADFFAFNDGENDLKIYYDTTSNKWVGAVLDSSDESVLTVATADLKVPFIINSISYDTYNTKTGEFKGVWKDFNSVSQNVSVFLHKEDETVISLEMQIHDESNPYTCIFSKIGTTSVTIPTYSLSGVEVDTSKTVLTVSNDVYNFDYALIKPIFENWLKGENAYSMDLVDQAISTRNCKTEKILFMNLSKDKIELYLSYEDIDTTERFIRQYNIVSRELYEELGRVESFTENELSNCLKNIAGGVSSSVGTTIYSVDYISNDADFELHKTEFNALTSKVIERVQTVGTQGNSIENVGSPIDYSGYNIISGFKTVPVGPSTTEFKCEGENYNFYLVYLVETNGNYGLLELRVTSSTERGYDKFITNITEQDATTANNWYVISSNLSDMSTGNGALFNYSVTTTRSVNYNARDVIVDDKDYLI